MAFLDFLDKAFNTVDGLLSLACDLGTTKMVQQSVEKGYQNGDISQEDYDKYREAVENYKNYRGNE